MFAEDALSQTPYRTTRLVWTRICLSWVDMATRVFVSSSSAERRRASSTIYAYP